MPAVNKRKYAEKDRKKYAAYYTKLQKIIEGRAPDTEKFRTLLEAARAAGYPIDWHSRSHYTLLHLAIYPAESIEAGLPQILLEAGADINLLDIYRWTPLERACWGYVCYGDQRHIQAVDMLLDAGAVPDPQGEWRVKKWKTPEERSRRDRLKAYIDTWPERRERSAAKKRRLSSTTRGRKR